MGRVKTRDYDVRMRIPGFRETRIPDFGCPGEKWGVKKLSESHVRIDSDRLFSMLLAGRLSPAPRLGQARHAMGRMKLLQKSGFLVYWNLFFGGKIMNNEKIEFGKFLDQSEVDGLTLQEKANLERNLQYGERLNKTFKRSPWYPFPRNLCFPTEEYLFKKWPSGRKVLVEIGVFEGASSLLTRQSMASDGVLHLIDPYVVIPDSKLTARPIMAKLNLHMSRNGHVEWHREYSYNVVKQWKQPIDFLFIDGDHSEAGCRKDWLDWNGFVNVGGVVIFHDARLGLSKDGVWDGWPGPSRIVNELFRGPNKLSNWQIVEESGSAVVVKRLY